MNKTDIAVLLLAARERLESYAYNLAWSNERAEDLLQETMFKILCNADKFENDGKFIYWAKTIMRNTFINNAKHELHCKAVDEFYYYPTATNSECSYYDTEIDVDDIYKAIDDLPGNAPTVMRMFITGHRYIDISAELEIPLGTVKTRINQSRAILKEILKDFLN